MCRCHISPHHCTAVGGSPVAIAPTLSVAACNDVALMTTSATKDGRRRLAGVRRAWQRVRALRNNLPDVAAAKRKRTNRTRLSANVLLLAHQTATGVIGNSGAKGKGIGRGAALCACRRHGYMAEENKEEGFSFKQTEDSWNLSWTMSVR